MKDQPTPLRKTRQFRFELILPMIVAHGDSDECLEWPYKHSGGGYGIVRMKDGSHCSVHRLAFKLAKPDEFNQELKTLHRCDNPPCFSLKHLFQGTQLDNVRDMDSKGRRVNSPRKGTNSNLSKLTDDQVRVIRQRRAAGEKLATIAADFGVTFSTIGMIARRDIWKHLP